MTIKRSFLFVCAMVLCAFTTSNAYSAFSMSSASAGTILADSQQAYGPPRFSVKDAANCYVAADNPGFWNFRGTSKDKEAKQNLEKISTLMVPIWWYELLSATGGDEEVAQEEAKIAKRIARRRLKSSDGLGSVRTVELLGQCIKLICQEYPDGHPKDNGETQICPR